MNNLQTIEIFDTVETFKGTTAVEKKDCFFILSAKELKDALNRIKPVIKKKNLNPILDCVKIEVTEGKVQMTASDWENNITVTMPAETKGQGQICIPFANFTGYLQTVLEGNLLFTFDFGNNTLILRRDNSVFKLTGFPADDFPCLPGENFAELLKLPANYFVEGINKTVNFTGKNELRPVMSHILIEAEKEVLRYVSTNAHQLAVYTIKNQSETYEYLQPENYNLLIHSTSAKILKTVLKGETGILRVFTTATNLKFKYQNCEFICRNSDLVYPTWRAVVPTELPNTLKVNRKELINVAARLVQVTNKTTHRLIFTLNGQCQVSAEDLEFANESIEFVKDFSYKGAENFEIGYSGMFLIDCLKAIDSEKVIVLSNASNKASLILPMSVNRTSDFVLLLMPVKLNDGEPEAKEEAPEGTPQEETINE